MMVIFISRSEGKSIRTVRKILDSFALRIGNDTWQTVITAEGLDAVKTLLRRSATKSTAVACHWIRSRSRSELVWIVGKRSKFNDEGIVPVHFTAKNISHREWENDWQYLPLVQAVTALAALLHDWGKASDLFQKKLKTAGKGKVKSDPFRHEWVSCKLLEALVQYTGSGHEDKPWLTALAAGNIDPQALISLAAANMGSLGTLPPIAAMIAWIIVSHHRMPDREDKDTIDSYKERKIPSFLDMLTHVDASWGYSHCKDKDGSCFSFSKGILWDESAVWKKCLGKWAGKMLHEEQRLADLIRRGDPAFRSIAAYSRLCLMMGDYYISSLSKDDMAAKGAYKKHSWRRSRLWANTERGHGLKQSLEEHVVMVMEQALQIAWQIPRFAGNMERAEDIGFLKKQSPKPFRWQDGAVEKIKQFRQRQEGKTAYFIVNMASTGCGKTIANAKIMNAVSEKGDSLRYVLALGLRTLTLQTGDEYRERIGLDQSELAVVIGSRTVQDLHEQDKKEQSDLADKASFGELERLLEEDVDYVDTFNDEQTAFLHIFFQQNSKKYRAFLNKPVLVATIDYLMAATETIRGGKYMLPFLRLMSSDLVIDEIDDFDKKDLIAISRLVHLAGMLGRSVAISSATIPPDLAQGMFRAYAKGLSCYNRFMAEPKQCGLVLCDEFKTQVRQIPLADVQAYEAIHTSFIEKRVQYLKKQIVKRKGVIVDVPVGGPAEEAVRNYFASMQKAALSLHDSHHIIDEKTGKNVSFGLVRLANISPCVACGQYFMSRQCIWPEGYAARVMTYHSRQLLIMRHEQEKYLDAVLKRKYDGALPVQIQDTVVRCHLDSTDADNVLFIVVATPVEEIGRDHDFDWAVVEPSSYRSLIQLAGRVLRHRYWRDHIAKANIAIMAYNLRGLRKEKLAFIRPGYETNTHRLKSHDMHELVDERRLTEGIDAVLRIQKPKVLRPEERLIDLEHQAMAEFNDTTPGPQGITGWLDEYWWITALPQRCSPFREGSPERKLIGVYDDGDVAFHEYQDGELVLKGQVYHIKPYTMPEEYLGRAWLKRSYGEALRQRAFAEGDSAEADVLATLSRKYGEIMLPAGRENTVWHYSDQFGLFEENI